MITNKNNLNLWDKVAETNPNFTSPVSYGKRTFTSVNAQYQLKQATTQWGPYGHKWGIENLDLKIIDVTGAQQMAIGRAVFFYPVDNEKASFIIGSSIMVQQLLNSGKMAVDDEFLKKLETDITTKALSKLGFSADVFLGSYDDNRYINDLKTKFAEQQQPTQPIAKKLSPQNVEALINKALAHDFEAVDKNLNYYKEHNVIIKESDLKKLKDLRSILQATPTA